MQEADQGTQQEDNTLAEEVMDSLGFDDAQGSEVESKAEPDDDLPQFAKEKIGKLQKRYQRDIKRMQGRIDALESHSQNQSYAPDTQQMNSYASPDSNMGSSEDEKIQRAVTMALQHKDMSDRHEKEREQVEHVKKQYQALHKTLQNASDKYEDFDDVVLGDDVPITKAMQDAALLIDNPADVLYKLGKNPDELRRISKLHPLEQAKEITRLSFALMGGNNNKTVNSPKQIGQIKNSPVNSNALTDKTSVGDLRRRLKADGMGWGKR